MDIENTIKNLERKGYLVHRFPTKEAAAAYLNQNIDQTTVGFGDSRTLIDMQLYQALSSHNTVYDPNQSEDNDGFLAIAKECLTTEVFLTSVNAMAETGEMVNIDGTGNRIAGSLFGHKEVFFVAGTNKIAPDLKAAITRARQKAGPQNAKKYELSTPCVQYGNKVGRYERCFDCSHPERICNALTIYYRRMDDTDTVHVVLIDEALGF